VYVNRGIYVNGDKGCERSELCRDEHREIPEEDYIEFETCYAKVLAKGRGKSGKDDVAKPKGKPKAKPNNSPPRLLCAAFTQSGQCATVGCMGSHVKAEDFSNPSVASAAIIMSPCSLFNNAEIDHYDSVDQEGQTHEDKNHEVSIRVAAAPSEKMLDEFMETLQQGMIGARKLDNVVRRSELPQTPG
jgi:hypothetical protein